MFSPYEPRYGDVVTFGITARIDSIVGRSNGRVTVILKTDAGRMYEAVYGADGEVESLRACGRDRSCAVQEHNPEDRVTVTTHKPLEVYSDDFKGFLEFNTYGPTCPKCGERDCGIDHSCVVQEQNKCQVKDCERGNAHDGPHMTDEGMRFSDVEKRGPQDDCDDCDACYECLKGKRNEFGMSRASDHMILCPDCGNKRCPKATWHWNACTSSNEPGQAGSRYTARVSEEQ